MAKLNFVLFFLFYVPSKTTVSGANYFKSTTSTTGTNATTLCNLATPEILFNGSGIQLNVITDDFNLERGEKVWVGYARVFGAFQYSGCSKKHDVKQYAEQIIEPLSLGVCYTYCNNEKNGLSDHIGLSGKTCYCISDVNPDQLSNGGCDSPCVSKPGGELCGGWEFVSVYTKVDYSPSIDRLSDFDQNRCLSLNATGSQWSNCSNENSLFCEKAANNGIKQSVTHTTWAKSMQMCLNQTDVPALRTTNFDHRTRHIWIGEIRSFTIVDSSALADTPKDKKPAPGYVELKNNAFHLAFDQGNGHQKKKAMCLIENEKETSTQMPNTEVATTPTKVLTSNTPVITNPTTEVTSPTQDIVTSSAEVVTSTIEGSKYFKSMNSSASTNASSLCNLATPKILFSEKKLQLKISTNDFYLEDGEKIWVGYAQVFEAFQYRGCSTKSDANVYKNHTIPTLSPGICYTFCNDEKNGPTTHIGLSGRTCYCISNEVIENEKLMNLSCGWLCSSNAGDLCGGADGHVSIYTKVTYLPNNSGRTDVTEYRCLSLLPKNSHYEWSNCSTGYSPFCEHAANNGATVVNGFIKWSTAMQSCLINSHVPAFRTTSLQDEVKYVWIGEIRSFVVVKSSEAPTDRMIVPGYVVRKNNTLHLTFGDTNGHHRAMCMTDVKARTEASTGPLPDFATSLPDTDNSKTFSAVLAVTVSVLVVAVAIGIGVFALKKRTRQKLTPSSADEHGRSQPEDSPTEAEYHVLEPVHGVGHVAHNRSIQYEVVDRHEDARDNRHETDDTYDRTFNVNRHVNETLNIYNTTDTNDGENMYNTSNDMNQKRNETENVYNKTGTDDTYDHTGMENYKHNATDNVYDVTESGDVYNSASGVRDGNVKGDNVYDVTKMEKTYSVASNKKSLGTRHTDNIYNLPESETV